MAGTDSPTSTIPVDQAAGTASFWLFRVIGNALPPRHAADHHLRTAEYILDHEPRFPDSRRTWILNQIVDPKESRSLAGMLQARGEHVVEVPFDPLAAARSHIDASGLPDDLLHPAGPLDTLTAVWRLEWLLRHKSLAVANVNRARNVALRMGRPRARWTLPLDGGVMFTAAGWDGFQRAIAANPTAKFAAIGFVRVDSFAGVAGAECPDPGAFEPQIAFRDDSIDVYDETLRYGHRNKVELLGRIGASGSWLRNANAPWDRGPPRTSPDLGAVCWGGFTVRLPTGATAAVERDNPSRWLARFDGIARLALAGDVARGRAASAARGVWTAYADPQRLDAGARARLSEHAAGLAARSVSAGQPGRGGDPVADLVWAVHEASVCTVAGSLAAGRVGPLAAEAVRVTGLLAESMARVHPRQVWERNPLRELWLLPQVFDLLAAAAVDPAALGTCAAWCRAAAEAFLKSPAAAPLLSGRVRPTAATLWMKAVVAASSLAGDRVDDAVVVVREVPIDLVALSRSLGGAAARPLREWVDIASACAALVVIGRRVGIDLLDYRGIDGEGIGPIWDGIGRLATMAEPQASAACRPWLAALAPLLATSPAAVSGEFVLENSIGIPPLWPALVAPGQSRRAEVAATP